MYNFKQYSMYYIHKRQFSYHINYFFVLKLFIKIKFDVTYFPFFYLVVYLSGKCCLDALPLIQRNVAKNVDLLKLSKPHI